MKITINLDPEVIQILDAMGYVLNTDRSETINELIKNLPKIYGKENEDATNCGNDNREVEEC